MKRLAISCAVALAVAFHARIGAAQCTNDSNCKGDRICENGRCVTPPAAQATTAPISTAGSAPAIRPAKRLPKSGPIEAFGKGYVELNVTIGFGSWGQKKVKSDDSAIQNGIETTGVDSRSAGTGPYGGIYLAPRWVASPSFHLGGYFRVGKGVNMGVKIDTPDIAGIDPYYDEDEMDYVGHFHLGIGGSIKFGGMMGKRVWFGGGLDVGFHLSQSEQSEYLYYLDYGANGADTDDDEKYLGFELLPRFCVDIFLFNFKMSIPLSVGAAIIPYAKWKPEVDHVEHAVDDDKLKAWIWQIEPVFMFGFAVGA
jgi:hypothetical protein